jgi:hypothetical protein
MRELLTVGAAATIPALLIAGFIILACLVGAASLANAVSMVWEDRN